MGGEWGAEMESSSTSDIVDSDVNDIPLDRTYDNPASCTLASIFNISAGDLIRLGV